ncbi:hypothetical protein [Paraflavitalea speifideaquila]|uniref:hypothetical protein n=1 Tax=Paraflavitalea speifideaquila TaxID=3076558 RepID=UPI0028E41674|nr:hypothetical protein [Paraflavitalea speifideiaquila]
MAWSWVLTGLGYGKKYMNKRHKALDYINQAVYPFYILHQSVMLVLVYYIVQVQESILMKYLFTVGATFFVSMSIYHLLIRPFGVMRFLFGMKPKEKQEPAPGGSNQQSPYKTKEQFLKHESAVVVGVPGGE